MEVLICIELAVVLPPKEYLSRSRDVFIASAAEESDPGIQLIEARSAVKYPKVVRTAC